MTTPSGWLFFDELPTTDYPCNIYWVPPCPSGLELVVLQNGETVNNCGIPEGAIQYPETLNSIEDLGFHYRGWIYVRKTINNVFDPSSPYVYYALWQKLPPLLEPETIEIPEPLPSTPITASDIPISAFIDPPPYSEEFPRPGEPGYGSGAKCFSYRGWVYRKQCPKYNDEDISDGISNTCLYILWKRLPDYPQSSRKIFYTLD